MNKYILALSLLITPLIAHCSDDEWRSKRYSPEVFLLEKDEDSLSPSDRFLAAVSRLKEVELKNSSKSLESKNIATQVSEKKFEETTPYSNEAAVKELAHVSKVCHHFNDIRKDKMDPSKILDKAIQATAEKYKIDLSTEENKNKCEIIKNNIDLILPKKYNIRYYDNLTKEFYDFLKRCFEEKSELLSATLKKISEPENLKVLFPLEDGMMTSQIAFEKGCIIEQDKACQRYFTNFSHYFTLAKDAKGVDLDLFILELREPSGITTRLKKELIDGFINRYVVHDRLIEEFSGDFI